MPDPDMAYVLAALTASGRFGVQVLIALALVAFGVSALVLGIFALADRIKSREDRKADGLTDHPHADANPRAANQRTNRCKP